MPWYFNVLIIYLLVINIIACMLTTQDKRAAKTHKWRIKESTLLIISALGGSIGMLITMLNIHHKTKHLKFMLGIPLIIIAQLAAIIIFILLRNRYGL